jgi:anti-sigma B factor antagonist
MVAGTAESYDVVAMDDAPLGEAYAVASDDHVKVVVSGEIDMLSTPQLDDVLSTAITNGAARVEVDLGKVEFLASTGLRSLVAAKQLADDRGVAFAIVSASEVARRVLELSGLESFLDT